MAIETAKNKICMHQIVDKKNEEIVTEGDIIVNDIKPDILNIISTNGMVYVYKKEVLDGKVKIEGTVNTYIIYLANDENGNTRTLNTSLDFTYITNIENCREGMTFSENIKIYKIETKILNERKINLKVTLKLEGTLCSDEEINFIYDIKNNEDIQTLNTNKTINTLMGKGSTKVVVKDTIKVSEEDNIAEIMRVSSRVNNKNTKISYNKVLAKADFDVEIIYLTEDNRICKSNMKIPIMGFIDMENVNDNSKCNTEYNMKNIIVKPDNNNEQCILVEAEFEIVCLTYERKEINLIEDMYSINSNLIFNTKSINSMIEKEEIVKSCNVNKQIEIPELSLDKLYNVESIPIINNYRIEDSKVIYECIMNIDILFKNSNNSLENKKIDIPFEFEVESDLVNKNDKISTTLNIKKDKSNLESIGIINIESEIEFCITVFSNENLNVINNLEMEECRDKETYSMIIYFVKNGDTLWKIAKKFKSTVDDIVRVNSIENKDKIYPGEQLYIPKYVKKNIA